jgi:hypothetical protein
VSLLEPSTLLGTTTEPIESTLQASTFMVPPVESLVTLGVVAEGE